MALDLPNADRSRLDALGDAVRFAGADVTDEDAVQSAVTLADDDGGLAVLVNCAGIGNAIEDRRQARAVPARRLPRVIRVNLIGTFNVLRLAAERDRQERAESDGERGVIVNTASVAAFDGQIGQAAYSASKGGVVGMTLPIARDLAGAGSAS